MTRQLTQDQIEQWWDIICEGQQRLQDLWLRDRWTPHRTAIQFGELCHDYKADARLKAESNEVLKPFHEWVIGKRYVGGGHRQDLAAFADQSLGSIYRHYGYTVTLAGSVNDGFTIATCEPDDRH